MPHGPLAVSVALAVSLMERAGRIVHARGGIAPKPRTADSHDGVGRISHAPRRRRAQAASRAGEAARPGA